MHALAFDHRILFLKQLEEVRERFSSGVQASFRTFCISALPSFLTAWCVSRSNPAMILPTSPPPPEGPVGVPRRSSPSPQTAGGLCKEDASGSRERWVSAPAGPSLLAALQEWLSWRCKDRFLRLILKRGSHKLLQKVQVGRYRALGWVLEVLLGQAGHIRRDCGEGRCSPRTRLPCLPAAPEMQNVVLPQSHVCPLRLSQSHCLAGESPEASGPVLRSSAMARPPRFEGPAALPPSNGLVWVIQRIPVQFVRPRKRVLELSSASWGLCWPRLLALPRLPLLPWSRWPYQRSQILGLWAHCLNHRPVGHWPLLAEDLGTRSSRVQRVGGGCVLRTGSDLGPARHVCGEPFSTRHILIKKWEVLSSKEERECVLEFP